MRSVPAVRRRIRVVRAAMIPAIATTTVITTGIIWARIDLIDLLVTVRDSTGARVLGSAGGTNRPCAAGAGQSVGL